MECPFPGMDPYIEQAAIWADFHDSLITEIRRELQPYLLPKYAALVQDRLYVVKSKRSIWPDVAVVKPRGKASTSKSASAVLDLSQPTVFHLDDEETREPYLEIIEPGRGNRLITAIEVLSPTNKTRGTGRQQYLKKRREVRQARANLVEIDLLRAGKPTFPITRAELAALPPWRYLAVVTRRPRRQEVHSIPLEKPLPKIGIPLTKADGDVPLDLHAAFTRVWQAGAYPVLLDYAGPPPDNLTPAEIEWCTQQLQQAGIRSSK